MGLKLKIKRIEKGIKQGTAAEAAGITQQYLGNLENGKSTNPSREVMLKLAALYDCSVQELFFSDK